jgi:fatty acid desaturase
MRYLLSLIFALQMSGSAFAESTPKNPLDYPLKQWMFILGLALFGGWASWWAKVRDGKVAAYNLAALIGELAISAFVGVVVFFICEYFNFPPLLTAAIVGVAGHMGTKALTLIEEIAEKRARQQLGGDK